MKTRIIKMAILAAFGLTNSTNAQLASVIPDAPLPTVAGPVLRPQNAGSSTLQNINFSLGGGSSAPGTNLYAHSWDVFSSASNNGIAWQRTNSAGVIQNQGHVIIPFAQDIDIAIFESSGLHYVLAAYYFNDPATPATRGHYYRIGSFTPGGITLGAPILLTLSPSFGRINVDANTPYGLAITWCVPGTGIYLKASQLPTIAFGCNLLLAGTSGFKDPDVAIRRSSGALDLELVYLNNAENTINEYKISLFNVAACSAAGLTLQHTVSTVNRFTSPRVDCPDQLSTAKFAYVYAEYATSGVGPITVGERIWAIVYNSSVSGTPSNILVRNVSYITNSFIRQNPVLAYDASGSQITVGWMTKENTTVLPGTSTIKYLAQYVSDPGPGLPVTLPTSLMMISNVQGDPFPVLAFSGQNNQSSFDGINAAFAQLNTFFPSNYAMVYKHKPFTSATFRMANLGYSSLNPITEPSIYPVPFTNDLNISTPLKGTYQVSVYNAVGKLVYENTTFNEADSELKIKTETFANGVYFLKIQSSENQIDITRKIIK